MRVGYVLYRALVLHAADKGSWAKHSVCFCVIAVYCSVKCSNVIVIIALAKHLSYKLMYTQMVCILQAYQYYLCPINAYHGDMNVCVCVSGPPSLNRACG